jgi:hypothetical protein
VWWAGVSQCVLDPARGLNASHPLLGKIIKLQFLWAFVWSLGANIHDKTRGVFQEWVRNRYAHVIIIIISISIIIIIIMVIVIIIIIIIKLQFLSAFVWSLGANIHDKTRGVVFQEWVRNRYTHVSVSVVVVIIVIIIIIIIIIIDIIIITITIIMIIMSFPLSSLMSCHLLLFHHHRYGHPAHCPVLCW